MREQQESVPVPTGFPRLGPSEEDQVLQQGRASLSGSTRGSKTQPSAAWCALKGGQSRVFPAGYEVEWLTSKAW